MLFGRLGYNQDYRESEEEYRGWNGNEITQCENGGKSS